MKKIMLFCATIVLTLFSCGKKTEQILSKLDIVGANSLLIGNKKDTHSYNNGANDSTIGLLKKDGNNYIQEVTSTWVDSSGKEASYTRTYGPTALFNFNEKYIYIHFKPGTDRDIHNYLIDTKTGDSYVFPDEVGLRDSRVASPSSIYRGINYWSDKNGNIYFTGDVYSIGNRGICKMNINNPNDLTLSILSSKGVNVTYNNAVDNEGNCFYVGVQENPVCLVSYLTTKDGVTHKIDDDLDEELKFWRGYDGEVYGFNKKDQTEDYYLVKWKVKDDSTAGFDYIKKLCWNYVEGTDSFLFLEKYKKVYSFGGEYIDYVYFPYLAEIYDDAKSGDEKYTMNKIDLSKFNLASYSDFNVSDDYIYILGKNASDEDVILKMDPTTNKLTSEPFSLDNQYKVVTSGMHVAKNNIITLELERVADQGHVIGTLDANQESPDLIISTTELADNVKSLILF